MADEKDERIAALEGVLEEIRMLDSNVGHAEARRNLGHAKNLARSALSPRPSGEVPVEPFRCTIHGEGYSCQNPTPAPPREGEVHALRGKYRGLISSSEEYVAQKERSPDPTPPSPPSPGGTVALDGDTARECPTCNGKGEVPWGEDRGAEEADREARKVMRCLAPAPWLPEVAEAEHSIACKAVPNGCSAVTALLLRRDREALGRAAEIARNEPADAKLADDLWRAQQSIRDRIARAIEAERGGGR